MATNFPTSLDSYTVKQDNVDDVLASHVNNIQDAIEAIEDKLGVSSSSVQTTIDYFLKHSLGTFKQHEHNGTDEHSVSIANLTEMDLSGSYLNKSMLIYNLSNAKFEDRLLLMSDISNLTLDTVANRLMFTSDGTNWIPKRLDNEVIHKVFSNFESKTYNTNYYADRDTLITAWVSGGGGITFYMDYTATPTTVVAAGYGSICVVALRGYYWKITGATGVEVFYIGSSSVT